MNWLSSEPGGGGVLKLPLFCLCVPNSLQHTVGSICLPESGTLTLNRNIIASNTADVGGGLSLYSNVLTLSNSTVNSNTAIYAGGGMDMVSGQARLNGNTISANTAGYSGGGLSLIHGAATLYSNTLSANTSGSEGGGLYLLDSSDAVLVGNIIASNATSTVGGGLAAHWGSTATLTGNIVISNTSRTIGGGVGIRDSHLNLSGNRLISNISDYGGGLALTENSTAMLTNNAIVANQTRIAGSGLGIQYSSIYMLHTTIASNTGGDGSGFYISDGSTAALTNTILASQTIGITTTAGSTATLDGVLWFGNGANTGGAGTIEIRHAYTGDPTFAPDDYHLNAGSAAINRGVRAGVTTDINGQARDAAPDLGADEYPLTEIIFLPIIVCD